MRDYNDKITYDMIIKKTTHLFGDGIDQPHVDVLFLSYT